MNRTRLGALACMCLFTTHNDAQSSLPIKRGFSVTDSIEMTTFSDPYTRDSSATAKLSPDGKYFMLITTVGVLRTNRLESCLWIYPVEEVGRYLDARIATVPRPQLLLRVAETPKASQYNSYGSLITNAQWSSDSRSILSLVEMSDSHRHVFRTSFAKVSSVDLTPGPGVDVLSFIEAAGTIAYVVINRVMLSKGQTVGEPINADGSVLTGLALTQILFADKYPTLLPFGGPLEQWVYYKGTTWKISGTNGGHYPAGPALALNTAVSPDGRLLITAQPVATIPDKWSKYESASNSYTFRPPTADEDTSGETMEWPWQYSFVNLDTRMSRPLVNAPSDSVAGYRDALQTVWSKDGQKVLFTSSYLPLSDVGKENRPAPASPCAVALYRVADGGISCITYPRFPKQVEYLRSVGFGSTDDEVFVHWWKDGGEIVEGYERRGDSWVLNTSKGQETAPQALTLSLHQDIDVPPSLWATNNKTKQTKLLWDPNPQLATVPLGKARVYRWTDASGHQWRGGLVMPPDYVFGHRHPLVIQTHGFYNSHEFLADGSYTSGFAAQPLAAAGIIVLQMEDRPDSQIMPGEQEALAFVAGVESAIDQLVRDGLADPTRVGIIGFSRTHWYVESALIHAPERYRAATLIDGIDMSYVNYILFAPYWTLAANTGERANGSKPFGNGLAGWERNAVGFNLDKVQAPARLEANEQLSILGEWETYSSLTLQGKPVDLICIPDGQHILQKPLDRYISQQGDVDWFRFWLQGYEDGDPKKATQYKRWRTMRTTEAELSSPK